MLNWNVKLHFKVRSVQLLELLRGRQKQQKRGGGGFRTARRSGRPEGVNDVGDDQCTSTISVPERSLYGWTPACGPTLGDGRQMDAGRGRVVDHIPLAARLPSVFARLHSQPGEMQLALRRLLQHLSM